MQTYLVSFPPPGLSASPCVEDETLFALARGELGATELPDVEAHLKDCADCRAVLAEAVRSLDTVPPGADAEPAVTSIARYRVDWLIGAGASGVVYRGFDPRLRRPVALKLLQPAESGATPEQHQRLLREAQAMARLSNPYVVAVYDTGLHDGKVYLVMEFVDGHTLTDWLREAPRSVTEILRVFAEAARGLTAAHESGLVHRDFKPANVLVARDGRARVTDFGLARESESWLAERHVDDQASTELYAPTRGLVGTPAYMAPELFESQRATRQSDQFAFAVALFVALFDLHPFKAGEGIGLSELIARTHAGTIQQPPLADARSERLFAAVQRGLAADPAARYPSLLDLMSAMERAAGTRHSPPWPVLTAAGVLVAGAAIAHFSARSAPSLDVPSAPTTVSAPSAPAAAVVSEAPAPSAAPAAVTSVPSAAPSSAPSSAPSKRLPPKPGDVRYKDWLKDPF
jgi:serine/threonine protein kinase